MSLLTLTCAFVLLASGAFGFRRSRHWTFAVAVVGGLAWVIFSAKDYVATRHFRLFSEWDLLLGPLALGVAFLAHKAGSRFAAFDRELYSALVELREALAVGPARQDPESLDSWILEATTSGHRVLRRFERIVAPDRESADLLRAYVELTRRTVTAIPSGVTGDERRQLADEGDELSLRYESLRPQHSSWPQRMADLW